MLMATSVHSSATPSGGEPATRATNHKHSMNTNDPTRGSMRILLVEDEILVRMFAVDALEDAGYSVDQAGTAAEALQALEQGQAVHAAIVDLGLPDRSGDLLAADMRASHADLPILIASGRSERELKERFSGDQGIAILVKPYTASMLVDALESLGVRSA
jgi:DNA-binding response OmpR family regulator